MTEVKHAGGIVSSSKVPALHLIPTEALLCLADRLQVGTERKGDGAWNALTKNQQCLDDNAFLIERCSHIIRHTLLLRDQLAHGYNSEQEDSPYENAGAIIFGGALMACAVKRAEEKSSVVCEGKGAECVMCGCHVASGIPACNDCIDYVKECTAPVETFENPDDWVPQDRCEYRPGIDEYRFVFRSGFEGGWTETSKLTLRHGEIDHFGDRAEIRCRRKDLPVVESPDDWVVQDRVPRRAGLDWYRWVMKNGKTSQWMGTSRAAESIPHGFIDERGARLEVQCRRKDLPELPAPAEEEWVDLNQYPDHVLRKDIDWIACESLEDWDPVNGFTGSLVEDLTSEYKMRCLKKDLPPSLVPKPPDETGQSLYPPHADASFMCRNHGVVSGLEFNPAQKMWFWKNRSDVCWDLNGKARRISLDITDAELRGFDIVKKIQSYQHEE